MAPRQALEEWYKETKSEGFHEPTAWFVSFMERLAHREDFGLADLHPFRGRTQVHHKPDR